MEIPPPAPSPSPWTPPLPPPLPASARRKKQVLARWALLALIPFFIVHFIWGWPAAKEKAGDGAIPFLTCQMVGGLFVSLLVAWIAYRMSSRSQYVGSIVFTALVLSFALNAFVPVCGFYFHFGSPRELKQSSPRTLATVPQQPQSDFPAFGFHVESPPGWQQVRLREREFITSWISPDSGGDMAVRALITVDWEEAGSKSVVQRADMYAKVWGGRIDDRWTDLDGERTVRVYGFAAKDGLKPVEVLVTRHGNRFFLITGAIVPGNSCHEQIEFIRQNWKWINAK